MACCACGAAALAQAATPPQRLLPLEVTVNGAAAGNWILLEREGRLYAPPDAFVEWRLTPRGDAEAVTFRGQRFLPLAAVPGFVARPDFGNQSVQLTFSPQAFAATRLARDLASAPVPDPVLPSVFLNYDASYTSVTSRTSREREFGVVTEAGVSTGWGVLTHSMVGRNLTGGGLAGTPRGWTRLETTFVRDDPAAQRTLRLGDGSTRLGLLARSYYFGGIQAGSNFALTPGFVTQPLPVLSGLSVAPSTVELYVNDVLRQVSSVPSGPFSLDNFPVVTGGGEARLVVRDILGRETVLVQPFFSAPQLLAAGLHDWSAEAGALRRDLGLPSSHYGERFASGLWRHGWSDRLTLEGHAELSRPTRVLGLGAIVGLPAEVLGRAAAAASRHEQAGSGHEWLLGAERQWLRGNVAVQAQGASRGFRDLTQDAGTLPMKLQLAGNVSQSVDGVGTFGLGFAQTRRYDGETISTTSANYSVTLRGRAQLTVSVSRARGGASGTAVGATLVVPLGDRGIATASGQHRAGRTDFYSAVAQTPQGDSGLGWRLLGGRQQDQGRAEAGAYYGGRYGQTTADLSWSPDRQAARVGAAGALVLADGRMFATQRMDQGFAVVEVAGYPDVGVGLGSVAQGRTDASGAALLPRLMPYQNNSVRLDPGDLPISAEIDSLERIAVPRARSGVKVTFPVRSGRAALLKVVFDDGEPAPAGATLTLQGETQPFYVARRGEAFVTGLQPRQRLTLRWKERSCDLDVTLPAADREQIARVGPLTCPGVPR